MTDSQPRGQDRMTDHLHLVNQIAHHDAAIGALGARMTGVESTLSHVQDKVMSLDSKVQSGFGSLESLIRENRAAQGPSMGELLKGIATGGAIVAMSAGAITMLVTSFVEPKIIELKKTTEYAAERTSAQNETDRQELINLRQQRRDMVDGKLDMLTRQVIDLNEKYGWAPTVTRSRGGS